MIQPLYVVDHAEQWLLGCRVGQQRQGCQAHQEPIRRVPGDQTERARERIALGGRQLIEGRHEGQDELMEGGKTELHLGLDANDPGNLHVGRGSDRVVQQRGLADPGLTAEHECAAHAFANVAQQAIERCFFLVSIEHG